MIQGEYKSLIIKLTDKTIQGKCQWSLTDEEGKYKLDIASSVIFVDRYIPYNYTFVVVSFSLFNESNRQIQNIELQEDEDDFDIVSALYDAVKNSVLKIDKTLLAINEAIDKL